MQDDLLWKIMAWTGRIVFGFGIVYWIYLILRVPGSRTNSSEWNIVQPKEPLKVENEEPYLFTDVQRMPRSDEPRRRISRGGRR